MNKLRVFLIEPFFAGSHKAWAAGYAQASSHEIHLVTHEADSWRWRMHGSAVTLAEQIATLTKKVGQPDILFVSDMVNVANLLGLTRHTVGNIPTVLYLHENQLTYPLSSSQKPNRQLSLINWISMVAADQIFINSHYHKQTLFRALKEFLATTKEPSHTSLLEVVEAKTVVLPVGVDLQKIGNTHTSASTNHGENKAPLLLWNQRWEYDKNPQEMFTSLQQLADKGVPFRISLAGENPQKNGRQFDDQLKKLGSRIVHQGFCTRERYLELLHTSDIVLSTALHEFFGISIVEAIAAGAVPVLPNHLSYPEIVPERFHSTTLYERGNFAKSLEETILTLSQKRAATNGLAESMHRFSWQAVAPLYDQKMIESTNLHTTFTKERYLV